MATPTGTDPDFAPIPPGWPGDDPTVPEELGALGARPARPRRPTAGDEPVTDRAASGPGEPADDAAGRVTGGDRADELAGDESAVREDATDPGDDDLVRDDLGDDLGDDELDLIAGVQPAGRVLVVMVAALVLAMLVNADALVERAERKPPGAARDRSLAIWHPVQDLSHVLQLYRVRQVADWAAGDDDDPPAAPAESARDSRRAPGSPRDGQADGTDTATPADEGDGGAPFALRTPTADEPLRLWIGGDFTAQVLGESLAAAGTATELVDPELHYESASGLTRPDYYDWPSALDEDVDEHEPEVVVVVFGANDGQGIVLADGTPVQVDDPRWSEEYGRRVGAMMDQLRADDRMVVWVGQPPMRAADYGARLAAINQVYAAQAQGRPWISFVDPAVVLGGPGGAYADAVPDAAGTPVEVRQPDGIHLTTAGGDLLAAHVLALVEAQVDLSPSSDGPDRD
jgi:hypothetical protein